MLAILGGKGGCGKTTTAVGLARAFRDRGERVLVVDCDCDMPNVHTVTDTPYRPGLGALESGAPVHRVRHESRAFPGVEVVPAGSETGAVSPAALGRLRRQPGRVILDCPAGATSAVTAPAKAADAALVVTTPDRASQTDAAKTARMVHGLETRLHGAVVTRGTGRTCEHLDGDCRILGAVPTVDGAVLRSDSGRASYASLAERVAKRNV